MEEGNKGFTRSVRGNSQPLGNETCFPRLRKRSQRRPPAMRAVKRHLAGQRAWSDTSVRLSGAGQDPRRCSAPNTSSEVTTFPGS